MSWFEEVGSSAAKAVLQAADISSGLVIFYPPTVDGVSSAFLIQAALDEFSSNAVGLPVRPEELLSALEESSQTESTRSALVLCFPPPPSLAQLAEELFQSLVVVDSSLPDTPDLRGRGVRANPIMVGGPECPCSVLSLAVATQMAPNLTELSWMGLMGSMSEEEYHAMIEEIGLSREIPPWKMISTIKRLLAGAMLAEPESAPHLIRGLLREAWADFFYLLDGVSLIARVLRVKSTEATANLDRFAEEVTAGAIKVIRTRPDRRLALAELESERGPVVVYDDDGVVVHASLRRHGMEILERFATLGLEDIYVAGNGREAEVVLRSSLLPGFLETLLGR